MEIVSEQPSASSESASSAESLFGNSAPAETSSAAPEVDSVLATQAAPVDENAELLNLLPADDGLEEIEHEGIKAKVPKELKDAFLRQQDYTRKTQETAEEKRQVQAERAAFQQQAQFQQQHLQDVAAVVSIDRELQKYEQVDWNKLIADNPQQALALDRQMRELQGQKAQLVQSLTQKQQQMALSQQQEIAKRTQEGQRELERDIKGWSPELKTRLFEYGKSQGFPPQVLGSVTEPAFVKMLHKAQQWDDLLARRTAKPPAAPAPKPITRVGGGGATNTKALSDLTPEEHQARRNEMRYAKRR